MCINIALVKTCIDNRLPKIKTTKDIAMLLRISSETLRKIFLNEEKISLRAYIFERKVLLMQEIILMNPDMLCKCVCYTVGLREDSGTRVFKRITGITMEKFFKIMKCPEKRKEFLTRRAKEIAEEKNYHA